jgi:hypothetical protein
MEKKPIKEVIANLSRQYSKYKNVVGFGIQGNKILIFAKGFHEEITAKIIKENSSYSFEIYIRGK